MRNTYRQQIPTLGNWPAAPRFYMWFQRCKTHAFIPPSPQFPSLERVIRLFRRMGLFLFRHGAPQKDKIKMDYQFPIVRDSHGVAAMAMTVRPSVWPVFSIDSAV